MIPLELHIDFGFNFTPLDPQDKIETTILNVLSKMNIIEMGYMSFRDKSIKIFEISSNDETICPYSRIYYKLNKEKYIYLCNFDDIYNLFDWKEYNELLNINGLGDYYDKFYVLEKPIYELFNNLALPILQYHFQRDKISLTI